MPAVQGSVTLPLNTIEDVLLARRRARDLAGLLQLGAEEQSRMATAVWEVARLAQRGGAGAEASMGVAGEEGSATIEGHVCCPAPDAIDPAGLSGLVDHVELRGDIVRLACDLAPDAWLPDADELALVLRSLQHHEAGEPSAGVEELRQQNAELASSLAALREREAELSETNRGITALVSELQQQAADLRVTAGANARFLHGLAHELRTPLYAVRGMTEAIMRDAGTRLDATTREDVRLIDVAVAEALQLVNDQLDLARLEAGREVVRVAPVDVAGLFAELGGVLRRLPRPDGVALIFEPPPPLPALQTDALKLSQILRNLVVNALKVTEDGAVRVTAAPRGGGAVRFEVADTGPGIAAENRERVFEEWVQIGTPSTAIAGTGLGLALVRRLSELLGGSISVESEPGAGATFALELPLSHPGASAGVEVTAGESPTER